MLDLPQVTVGNAVEAFADYWFLGRIPFRAGELNYRSLLARSTTVRFRKSFLTGYCKTVFPKRMGISTFQHESSQDLLEPVKHNLEKI
jgi:hypothetical protein